MPTRPRARRLEEEEPVGFAHGEDDVRMSIPSGVVGGGVTSLRKDENSNGFWRRASRLFVIDFPPEATRSLGREHCTRMFRRFDTQLQTPNIMLLLGIGAFVAVFRLVKPYLFPERLGLEGEADGATMTNQFDVGWCTRVHLVENVSLWLVCVCLLRFGFKTNPRMGKTNPPPFVWWHVIFAILLVGAVLARRGGNLKNWKKKQKKLHRVKNVIPPSSPSSLPSPAHLSQRLSPWWLPDGYTCLGAHTDRYKPSIRTRFAPLT